MSLLSADVTIRSRTTWNEQTDGSVVVDHQQDVEPVVELNKAQFNESDGRFQGDLKHMARIPLVVYEGLIRQGIVTWAGKVVDPARFKAWLNDSDNRAFRTHPGRV